MTREEWDKLTADEQWEAFGRRIEPLKTIQGNWPIANFEFRWNESATTQWKPPVDDQGNPPPIGLYGDMFPHFEDGQWWVCHDSLVQHRREKGTDRP